LEERVSILASGKEKRLAPANKGANGNGTPAECDVRIAPLLLGGILAIATALDLFHLGARSLWLDESTSVAFAQLGWNTLGKILWHGEANMALYYGLLHVWVGLFGSSEFTVRMLSASIAVGAVGAIYALGTRLFDSRIGLISALLLAVNAYNVAYAQEARSYSLLVLLVTLASLAFLRMLARPSRLNFVLCVTESVLAVYAHFFAILVLAAHWLSVVFLRRLWATLRIVLMSAAIICLLLVPLVYVAMRHTGLINSISRPSIRDVLELLYALTGASPTGNKALLAMYFMACLATLVVAIRQSVSLALSYEAWRYWFLLAWFACPIFLALGVSIVKPIFVPYYLIICLPPLVLLASLGISRIRARYAAITVLIVISAMSLYEDARYYRIPAQEDWRGAVSYVASHGRSGEGLVFYPAYLQQPYDYYHSRLFLGQNLPIAFPQHWGWARMANGEPMEEQPPNRLLKDFPRRYSRIWLFSSYPPVSTRLLKFLAEHYNHRVERAFHAVRVTFYSEVP
jgi:mannosyltransferase